MRSQRKVFLFDIDGVLIRPFAYYACVGLTVAEFAKRLGINNVEQFPVTDSLIHRFESIGVYSPWDISAILCGAILTALSEKGIHCEENSSYSALLQSLLNDTRSAYGSLTTRIYQNLLLGEEFQRVYHLDNVFSGPSLLQQLDKVLLAPQMVARLKTLWTTGKLNIAAYTGRPSSSLDPDEVGCSPETEIALNMLNFSEMPYVGLGTVQWLANKNNIQVKELAKPNLTQAIAAILTALSPETAKKNLVDALKLSLASAEELINFLPDDLEVTVFEDTSAGIIPLRTLISKMNAAGSNVSLRSIGIAKSGEKIETLELICERVFEDINIALEYVLTS